MPTVPGDEALFKALCQLLRPLAKSLVCVTDSERSYYLNTCRPGPEGKPVFFGAVQRKKGGVSFHLMPVYSHPELLKGASALLKKSMTGKSCFTFKAVDPAQFKELGALAQAGLDTYRKAGLA